MKTGRPKEPVILSDQEHEQFTSIFRCHSLPQGLVSRAQIVLMAAEGAPNREITKKVGLSPQSVCKWRQRYFQQGISGLHDELRAGRPRSFSDEEVATLIRETLNSNTKDATPWTTPSMATETKLSGPTVHRVWNAFGLLPHGQRYFKLSTAPFFVEKVRNIVGLYVSPLTKPWSCA